MGKIKALTISEAAKLKGVTRQALHYAIEEGKVKTVKIVSERIGILPDELAKYKPREKNSSSAA